MSDTSRPSRTPAARTAPRNVPMLTEVVGEQQRAAASAPPQPQGVDEHEAQVTQVSQAVLESVLPTLEQRISEAIARVLHEQMLGLNARVRRAVADEVRGAVAEALRQPSVFPDGLPPPSRM
ncbi:MAG: hypothetical protein IJR28_05275 [Ottowia sp.]|nr:hypothetical protein [Ottowia sp.]